MKIARSRLKEIVKEELEKLDEADPESQGAGTLAFQKIQVDPKGAAEMLNQLFVGIQMINQQASELVTMFSQLRPGGRDRSMHGLQEARTRLENLFGLIKEELGPLVEETRTGLLQAIIYAAGSGDFKTAHELLTSIQQGEALDIIKKGLKDKFGVEFQIEDEGEPDEFARGNADLGLEEIIREELENTIAEFNGDDRGMSQASQTQFQNLEKVLSKLLVGIDNLDRSLDFLASAVTGVDPTSIDIAQRFMGRMAHPGKSKESPFNIERPAASEKKAD